MQNRLHNIAYWINFYKSPYLGTHAWCQNSTKLQVLQWDEGLGVNLRFDSLWRGTIQHRMSSHCKHQCRTDCPTLPGWCTSWGPGGRTPGQSWPERRLSRWRRWWPRQTWPTTSWCRTWSGRVSSRPPAAGSEAWASYRLIHVAIFFNCLSLSLFKCFNQSLADKRLSKSIQQLKSLFWFWMRSLQTEVPLATRAMAKVAGLSYKTGNRQTC